MTAYTAEDTFEALKRVPFDIGDVNDSSIEIEDVNRRDYPDFCDAFIGYAEFNNGTPLDDWQLEQLNDEYPELVSDLAHDSFRGA